VIGRIQNKGFILLFSENLCVRPIINGILQFNLCEILKTDTFSSGILLSLL
jgi:hypothetical protein